MAKMVGDAVSIQALEYAEELGDYRNVALFMRLSGENLRASEDTDAKDRYEKLLERSASAFEYEKIYGKGSLLKLEKPLNKRLIAMGLISPEEVEAALRHCQKQSAFTLGPEI